MAQGFGSRLGNLFGCTTVPVDIEVAGVGTGWLLDFLLVLEKCGYPGTKGVGFCFCPSGTWLLWSGTASGEFPEYRVDFASKVWLQLG